MNVVISIGGASHSKETVPNSKTTVLSAIAATHKARQTFVRSCIDLFIKPLHPQLGPLFGGIDIDWEFPKNGDHHATLLLQEFRKQLDVEGQAQGRRLTLSACTRVDYSELEFAGLASSLDWVNLMAYLAHAPNNKIHNKVTDFNSPLFPAPNLEPKSNVTWSIDPGVDQFLKKGFPAAKLVLGINAYARTYAGVPNSNHGVYQSYTGPGPGSLGKRGELAYKDLMTDFLPRYESHWDSVTQSAYLYSRGDSVWMSYDSVRSVETKAAYANEKGLGGLMLWELSADALSVGQTTALIPALLDAMALGGPSQKPVPVGDLRQSWPRRATTGTGGMLE